MPKPKHERLIRFILYLPVIFLAFIIQALILPNFIINGVKPLILPILVVGAALFHGSFGGAAMGLTAGILCDISFNQPVVQFTLVLTFVGLAVGLLTDTVLARGFPSFLVCCICVLFICTFFQTSALVINSGTPFIRMLPRFWKQMAYSLLFALPIYYLSRFISRMPKV